MFRAGEPEKLVMEHTGHRMVKALRMYERTSTSQHAAVSKYWFHQRRSNTRKPNLQNAMEVDLDH